MYAWLCNPNRLVAVRADGVLGVGSRGGRRGNLPHQGLQEALQVIGGPIPESAKVCGCVAGCGHTHGLTTQ